MTEAKDRLEAGQREAQKRIDELQEKAQAEGRSQTPELVKEVTRLEILKERTSRQLKAETERLKQERDRKLKKIDNELEQDVPRNKRSTNSTPLFCRCCHRSWWGWWCGICGGDANGKAWVIEE